ncbi:hypothetical protein HAX54_025746, partial [Datura stramonium]|nr:hypothetical protein [Datura stramonium]
MPPELSEGGQNRKKIQLDNDEEDQGTHGKICIEEQSLYELNAKVVKTTCSIEQVHVDQKDKCKENKFGPIQGNTHDKKSNKAVVDLTPMSKEKRDDVVPLLHKINYGLCTWFIDILGISTTSNIFWE